MSICIVDDAASQRLLLTSILKAAGYTNLLVADSASAAFGLLGMNVAEHTPEVDLILMDISMPGTDGIEACRQIKSMDSLKDVPIIMVTASTETEDLQLAFAAGAIDYITKPINKLQLLARVRSALRLKHEMDRRKAREQELLEVTRQLESANQILKGEREKSDRLLLNVLPKTIADRLKSDPGIIAESFDSATVLFADIVDFTKLSERVAAHDLVIMLNEVFSLFDRLAEKHGLEKIKTIGDAYMLVGGIPTPRPDHIEAVADMALDIQRELANRVTVINAPLQVRIGIHTGPVAGGVIGTKKFIYDLWGDTVNIASRMESHGVAGAIQVTDAVRSHLAERYVFEPRGTVPIKGKSDMDAYLLIKRNPMD